MPGLCYICITFNASLIFFNLPSPIITTYCSFWELLKSPQISSPYCFAWAGCFSILLKWDFVSWQDSSLRVWTEVWEPAFEMLMVMFVCWLFVVHTTAKCLFQQGVTSGSLCPLQARTMTMESERLEGTIIIAIKGVSRSQREEN